MINTSVTTSLYSLLQLFIKRNLFIIILANRSTRWGFIFIHSLCLKDIWRGQSKTKNSLTRLLPSICSKLASKPLNSSPLFSHGKGTAYKDEKGNFTQKKKNNFRTFNYKPYAICTRLLKTPTKPLLLFSTACVFGDVRIWRGARVVTRMTPNYTLHKSNAVLMCWRGSLWKSTYCVPVHMLLMTK